jgi:hypothetical protein
MDIDDWQDNGDGTCTVKSEGAKLWDVWGADSYEATGLTEEESRNIHVGDTFGKKVEENPVITGDLNTIIPDQDHQIQSQNQADNTSAQNQVAHANTGYYSKIANFFIGLGEVLSGLGIIIGGGFAAAALAPETVGASAMVGYDAVIIGGATFAYGLTRMTGANNKPFGEDVKNIIVPPMAAFITIDPKDLKP